MGSGSFGGGSGSFGAGGSGGGSGASGARASGSRSDKTDSAHERILNLQKLTDQANSASTVTAAAELILQMLEDRTRSAFLRETLTDPMLLHVYRGVLSLDASLRNDNDLRRAAARVAGEPVATLADLSEVLRRKGQRADTDERVEEITRRSLDDLLLRTVNNRHALFYDAPLESLGDRFKREPLQHTADRFLGTIIAEVVRRDLLRLQREAPKLFGDASRAIGVSWTDRFKAAGSKSFDQLMETIAGDFAAYLGGPGR